MKLRNKLLMPILGTTAIAGAIVPTLVSCGNKDKIRMTYKVGDDNPYDKITIISKKVKEEIKEGEEKEKIANITVNYKYVGADGKSRDNIVNEAKSTIILDGEKMTFVAAGINPSVTDDEEHEGQYILTLTLTGEQYKPNQTVLDFVFKRESVTSDATYVSFNYDNSLAGFPESGDKRSVEGISSQLTQPVEEWTTSYLGYEFNLSTYQDVMSSSGSKVKTIVGVEHLILYIQSNSTNRIVPTYFDDVYLIHTDQTGSDVREALRWHENDWLVSDLASITIDMPEGGITQDMIDKKYRIGGNFSMLGQLFQTINGSKVCIYDRGQIE